jgi:CheY-like chemotaxis protein
MLGNILIGEDNLISQQVMEALLEAKCKKIKAVGSYAELMEELEIESYDLLLLDFHLDRDADFMVAQIRQGDSPNKGIPIFILSAEPEITVLEKMRGINIDGYIKKPIDFPRLEVALNRSQLINTFVIADHPLTIDIDLSHLEVLLGDSPDRVKRIVMIFMTETPDYFIRMEHLLAKQDWQNLKALVHRARASYGYLGLTSLHTQLTQWESDIEAGLNQSTYSGIIDAIKAETLMVREKLEKLYPSNKS